MSKPQSRPRHPGRTPAQRRVLDAIGCGNLSPFMANRTRDALLGAGLIRHCGDRMIGSGWPVIRVAEYTMPIPVHMQWCDAVAFSDEEMAEFEAALAPHSTDA